MGAVNQLRKLATLATMCFFGLPANSTSVRLEPACEYYPRASAIFLGTVTGVVPVSQSDRRIFQAQYRFEVNESFKGVQGNTAELLIGSNGETCYFSGLQLKRQYLVVTRTTTDNRLMAYACDPLLPADHAVADVSFLRSISPLQRSATYLYGSILPLAKSIEADDIKYTFLSGIRITATGEAGPATTTTDARGYFQFLDLQPGSYTVGADLPPGMRGGDAQAIKLISGTCNKVTFGPDWYGQIGGTITDFEGHPVTQGQISLTNVDRPRGEDTIGGIDDDGHFFFDRLIPGNYRLVFNDIWAPDSDSPYPPTFYPSADNPDHGSVMKLDVGQQMLYLDFRLPRPLERSLRIQVLWPSQRPASNALLIVEYEHSYYWEHPQMAGVDGSKVNADGRVDIPLCGNGKVRFYAMAEDKAHTAFYARPIVVELSKLPRTTTLVLSQTRPPYIQ